MGGHKRLPSTRKVIFVYNMLRQSLLNLLAVNTFQGGEHQFLNGLGVEKMVLHLLRCVVQRHKACHAVWRRFLYLRVYK